MKQSHQTQNQIDDYLINIIILELKIRFPSLHTNIVLQFLLNCKKFKYLNRYNQVMQQQSLPSVHEVRNRIEKIESPDIRLSIMTAYLYAGRISEVIGKATPGDTTVARGPAGTDATLDTIEGHEAVLFNVYTAKRDGLLRVVALPIETEPWAKLLYDYFQSKGTAKVFPFTRQIVWCSAKETFKGLTYPVDKYRVVNRELQSVREVPKHDHPFALHALRHLRATELVNFYHFKAEDLAAYCGWRLTSLTKMTTVMERYIGLQWQDYFPKLLKRRA
jgi:hypothetical protein